MMGQHIQVVRTLLFALLCCSLCPQALSAANFVLVDLDSGTSEGINDTTSASPVGGNTGTTIGEQREIALEYAMAMLGQVVNSSVDIRVEIDFDNTLFCNSSSATLASAGAVSWTANTPGVPLFSTWYPYPLANSFAGSDQFPGANDISVNVNGNLDNNNSCLNNTSFYYGLDGNAGGDIDFITTIMHELIHGLGFQTLVNLDSTDSVTDGQKGGPPYYNDTFMRNLEDNSLGENWSGSMTSAQRFSSATDTGDLLWTGAQTTANLGGLSAGTSDGKLRMYAPSSISLGSSVSHIDSVASPNELMEHIQNGPKENIGLAAYMLADIGWSTNATNSPIISQGVDIALENTSTADVSFAVLDNDTNVSTLNVSASSSNTSVLPNANLTFSGSGRLRTLNIVPNSGTTGPVTITIDVSDGSLTSQTSFVVNVISDNPPLVSILAPLDGSVFYSAPQSLSASANDIEDGDLSSVINWLSSIDGSLGVGAGITPSLSDGVHTITASAIDSDTNTGDDAISITVDLLGDLDSDGLNNATETALGTDLQDSDSDNDGLSDFDEVNADSDPSNYAPGIDSDPNNNDTDGDMIPDGIDPEPLTPTTEAYNIPATPIHFMMLLALILIGLSKRTSHSD